jgi:hypothetical protein
MQRSHVSHFGDTVVFLKEGQVMRNASFLRYIFKSNINYCCCRPPRILHICLTSRLALQIASGLPLGILRYYIISPVTASFPWQYSGWRRLRQDRASPTKFSMRGVKDTMSWLTVSTSGFGTPPTLVGFFGALERRFCFAILWASSFSCT